MAFARLSHLDDEISVAKVARPCGDIVRKADDVGQLDVVIVLREALLLELLAEVACDIRLALAEAHLQSNDGKQVHSAAAKRKSRAVAGNRW